MTHLNIPKKKMEKIVLFWREEDSELVLITLCMENVVSKEEFPQ